MAGIQDDDCFDRPNVMVDIVLLSAIDDCLQVALYPREKPPFAGVETIIGGYVHVDEDDTAEAAVRRVLDQKAGLSGVYFEQLQTFSGRDRDPRGWSVSIAYLALVPSEELKRASLDKVQFAPVDEVVDLPFDHNSILSTAIERLRGKGAYSILPAHLLKAPFSMPELQQAYETVLGVTLDQSSFRRKVVELGFVVESDKLDNRPRLARRPPKLFELAGTVTMFDRHI